MELSETILELIKEIAPYEKIWLALVILFTVILFADLGFILYRVYRKAHEKRVTSRRDLETLMGMDYTGRSLFDRDDAMQKIIAPDGIDPNASPSYMILNDAGRDIFIRTFTLTAVSKITEFAKTFSPLLNFSSSTSSIKLTAISSEEMQRLVNKHITTLTTEYNRSDDVNRSRQLQNQLHAETELANNLEVGNSSYYNVELGITIRADSLDKLSSMTDSLLYIAKKSNLNLAGCFAVQPEAFLSMAPVNRTFNKDIKLGFLTDTFPFFKIKSDSMESFLFDQNAASTFFNYQQNDFNQKEGAFIGWNIQSKAIASWDPFLSKQGYNVIFAGMTRSGKSTAQKCMVLRMAHNTRFVAIDSQRVAGLDTGEYTPLCKGLNGRIYRISNDANSDKMNIFEIATSTKAVTDEFGKVVREDVTLQLNDAKISIANILMMIITSNSATRGSTKELGMSISINDKITEIVTQLYDELGIRDGVPDSLYIPGYEHLQYVDRPAKKLPTLTRFFEIAAFRAANAEDEGDKKIYRLLMSAIKEYVTYCAYNRETGEIYSEEVYESLEKGADGTRYVTDENGNRQDVLLAKGSRLYYDGQSTLGSDTGTDKRTFTNIDISGLPESEISLARSIAVHVVNQKFIMANSESPDKAERLVVIYDEAHYLLNDPYAAQIVSAQARTCGKKHVSMWLSLQQLTDAENNNDARIVIENSAQLFLFKHKGSSKKFVQTITGMSDSQFANLCDLGGDPDSESGKSRKGECCLCMGKHSYFIKVAYIKETEGLYVETDPQERALLYNKKHKSA